MKAYLHAVRIAPKKANLICKMIRGMTTADAMHTLERTNKKAARILEELLRSAMANASHNDKQDAQTLVIKSLIVNQGQAYHRGVPMARGRVRPMRKFLSHIELVLGLPEDEEEGRKGRKGKKVNKGSNASQKADSAVKNAKKSSASAKEPKASSRTSKQSS
ncbi:50S ribosomal protein L22 [Candidatus Peribacteria bacterium RIFCSPHIGHO2_01_FULL_55_13]|nr:MAG: 50S ribosomal protein L22 [Candidatus Peribacteria bacterium RIFCSPHIGHO2_01_FULL_55_13]